MIPPQDNGPDPDFDPEHEFENEPEQEKPKRREKFNKPTLPPMPSKRALLWGGILTGGLFLLLGIIVMLGNDEPRAPTPREPTGTPTLPQPTPDAGIRNQPPPVLQAAPGRNSFGTIPYNRYELDTLSQIITIPIQHAEGPVGPIRFLTPEVTPGEDTKNLPEVQMTPRQGNLGLIPYCYRDEPLQPSPSIYCNIEVLWDPDPGEKLAGTTIKIPFVSQRAPTLRIQEERQTGVRPWEQSELTIPLTGSGDNPPPPPTLGMTQILSDGSSGGSNQIDLGSDLQPETPHTFTLELRSQESELEITSIEAFPQSQTPESFLLQEPQSCAKIFLPSTQDRSDFCRIRGSWTPQQTGDLLSGTIEVQWQYIDLATNSLNRNLLEIPLKGYARTLPARLHPNPEQITAIPGQAAKGLQITARNADLRLGQSFIQKGGGLPLSANETLPQITSQNCPETLERNQTCMISIRWDTNTQNNMAPTTQAEVIIPYGIADSTQTPQTLTISIFPRNVTGPSQGGIVGIDPRIIENTRQMVLSRRALPALQPGLGTIQIPRDPQRIAPSQPTGPNNQQNTPEREPQTPANLERLERLELLEAPQGTLSGRPVVYNATIVAGTPIQGAVVTGFDSLGKELIVAVIQRSVMSSHNRNVVVPAGSQILGKAPAAQNGETSGALAANSRVLVNWHTIRRPDGASFPINETTYINGVVELYEQERYATALAQAGIEALVILGLGDDQETTTQQGVGAGAISQVTSTSRSQQAANRINEGLRSVAGQMADLIVPPPLVEVPAGTKFTLRLRENLILKPATQGGILQARSQNPETQATNPTPEPNPRTPELSQPSQPSQSQDPALLTTKRPLSYEEIQQLQNPQGGTPNPNSNTLQDFGQSPMGRIQSDITGDAQEFINPENPGPGAPPRIINDPSSGAPMTVQSPPWEN